MPIISFRYCLVTFFFLKETRKSKTTFDQSSDIDVSMWDTSSLL